MYSRGLCLGFFVIHRRKRLPDPIGPHRYQQAYRANSASVSEESAQADAACSDSSARIQRSEKNVRPDNTESLICIGDAQATTRKQAFAIERIVMLIDDTEIKRRPHRGTSREKLRRPFWVIARWQLITLEASTATNMMPGPTCNLGPIHKGRQHSAPDAR